MCDKTIFCRACMAIVLTLSCAILSFCSAQSVEQQHELYALQEEIRQLKEEKQNLEEKRQETELVVASLAATCVKYSEPPEPVYEPPLRYDSIDLSYEDWTHLALCVYHESRGEPIEGQRAVAEVILNRILFNEWPDNVTKVIFDKGQFECASYLTRANINEPERLTMAYEVIDYVLKNDDYILDADFVFFKTTPYKDREYVKIGNHYFAKM